MNLANKLTLFRIVLVPFFVAALMIHQIPYNLTIALFIFALASITDWLDGYIARKHNMITAFGKFLDPIADKILVMAALVCFAGLGWIQSWVVVVILSRDFIVGGIRLAAVESEEKIVIPARLSGKVKTAITMVSICGILVLWALARDYSVIMFENEFSFGDFTSSIIGDPGILLRPIANAAMYFCALLTVISGVQYVWDCRGVFKEKKAEKKSASPVKRSVKKKKRKK